MGKILAIWFQLLSGTFANLLSSLISPGYTYTTANCALSTPNNGLSLVPCHTIIWNNPGISFTGTLETNDN